MESKVKYPEALYSLNMLMLMSQVIWMFSPLDPINMEDVPRLMGLGKNSPQILFTKACFLLCETGSGARQLLELLDGTLDHPFKPAGRKVLPVTCTRLEQSKQCKGTI